jgi:hypothetical protein
MKRSESATSAPMSLRSCGLRNLRNQAVIAMAELDHHLAGRTDLAFLVIHD